MESEKMPLRQLNRRDSIKARQHTGKTHRLSGVTYKELCKVFGEPEMIHPDKTDDFGDGKIKAEWRLQNGPNMVGIWAWHTDPKTITEWSAYVPNLGSRLIFNGVLAGHFPNAKIER